VTIKDMKVLNLSTSFIADPSDCGNKWCSSGVGSFPATGNFPVVSECSSYNSLVDTQLRTGGISGRGVTPCPYGFLNRVPVGESSDINVLIPLGPKNIPTTNGNAIFFDPYRPGWLPPTGGVRSLIRVGNEWKN
jgi:hypothetical protein